MKKHLIIMVFSCLMIPVFAQQPFRLYMAAGRSELIGDGDDYTTLVITARNVNGEIMQNISGDISVRTNAGLLDVSTLKMQNGVAMVKYTAPILGQPVKASQRIMLFLVKIIQKLIGKSAGSTDFETNKKNAADASSETIKEGVNPFVLTVKDEKNAFAYFVCEMNGVKGKAKIHILKAAEGGNASILPGSYHGYDITGQAEFTLEVSGGGFGRMKQGGTEANTILFTSEPATEFNNAMVKMLGGGGFMNAYLGLGASELKYIPDYNIKKMGIGTYYLPMPDNGIFLYVPPILFEYGGRTTLTNTASNTASNTPSTSSAYVPLKLEPKETVGITCEPLPVIGDGRSKVKVKFEYKDEKGVPLAGKKLQWSFPKEFKVLSQETVTNSEGIANAELQAPVIKGGEWKTSDISNFEFISDNTSTFQIAAYFDTPKKQKQSTSTPLNVYKTKEFNVHILKPGFERGPFKILLPNEEFYKLQGNLFAVIEAFGPSGMTDELSVNDAVVVVEGRKFDKNIFTSTIQDKGLSRKNLITRLNGCGVVFGFTDSKGDFSFATSREASKLFKMEPVEVKISDLTGRRKGSLTKVLDLFNDTLFCERMANSLYEMDAELCSSKRENAQMIEEKLHILGNLMTNANSSSEMVKETSEAMIDASWELFMATASFVNEKCKITDKLWESNVGIAWQNKGAAKIKDIIEWSGGPEIKGTLQAKIYKELKKRIFLGSERGKIKGLEYYYKASGESVYNVLAKIFENVIDWASEELAKSMTKREINPKENITKRLVSGYYTGIKEKVDAYMAVDPQKVHAVYARLQPLLIDKTTDFRSTYADVGKFRMAAGYRKALKDLLTDISKSLVVAGTVFITRDYKTMAKALEKIESWSKGIDVAMAAYNTYKEYGNYCALLLNVQKCFEFVDDAVVKGNFKTAQTFQIPFTVNLFPSAIAGVHANNTTESGFTSLPVNELKASENYIPVDPLILLIDGYQKYDKSLYLYENKMFAVANKDPTLVAEMMKTLIDFEDHMFSISVLTTTLANDPQNEFLIQEWNLKSALLVVNAAKLNEKGIKFALIAAELPANTPLILPPAEGESMISMILADKSYILYGSAGLGIILLTVVVMLFIRKRKRSTKKKKTGTVTQIPNISPSVSATTTGKKPVRPDELKHITPKFCPGCGSPFKPGAKFCGKCGFKSV